MKSMNGKYDILAILTKHVAAVADIQTPRAGEEPSNIRFQVQRYRNSRAEHGDLIDGLGHPD
jgi:hypothetical protein